MRVDRVLSAGAGFVGTSELKLQQVLGDAGELRGKYPAVAFAQAVDLLGQVLEIEIGDCPTCHLAPQKFCLLLRPGEEVTLVDALPLRWISLGLRHLRLADQSAAPPSARGRAPPNICAMSVGNGNTMVEERSLAMVISVPR